MVESCTLDAGGKRHLVLQTRVLQRRRDQVCGVERPAQQKLCCLDAAGMWCNSALDRDAAMTPLRLEQDMHLTRRQSAQSESEAPDVSASPAAKQKMQTQDLAACLSFMRTSTSPSPGFGTSSVSTCVTAQDVDCLTSRDQGCTAKRLVDGCAPKLAGRVRR